MILTVALPMFKANNIAWLALESLCRQKVPKNIKWELIILEEIYPKSFPFGRDRLLKYEDRLKKANCIEIKYFSLNKWMPLANKWIYIAKQSRKNSIGFLLQAADCYSQPWRIMQTAELFKQGYDWIQSPKGVFYNIINGQKALFYKSIKTYRPTLNMAMKTHYVRNMIISNRRKGVDGWLFKSCQVLKHGRLKIGWNTHKKTWLYGVDTHGKNQISKRRGVSIRALKAPFRKTNINIFDYLPNDIGLRLKRMRLP